MHAIQSLTAKCTASPALATRANRTNQIPIARTAPRRAAATPGAPRYTREKQKHSKNQSASGAVPRTASPGRRADSVHPDTFISSDRRGSPSWPRPVADAFDYSAINLHMAKQLVKDLLEAFDAEGNRSRLARALVQAQEKTDALMLQVAPLAVDIASEALSRWGIVEHEGDAFVRVMERISLLAPRDEELSFDVYQLHQKFLPVPPKGAVGGGSETGQG